MPSLREVQQAMRAAIVARDTADIASHIDGGAIAAEDRLAIYRNTYASTLTRALRLTYPAVDQLVGAEFFDGATMSFVHEHPPREAWLDAYGADFADFLAGFRPAASVPYLADVARLEWAVSRALHAPERAKLSAADIVAGGIVDHTRIRFTPDPSLGLVRAAFPVDRIWRAVLDRDDAALVAIDPASGPVHLLVQRGDDAIDIERLDQASWRFAAALCAGAPLGAALAAHPDCDATPVLADFLARGRFIDFSLAPYEDGIDLSEDLP